MIKPRKELEYKKLEIDLSGPEGNAHVMVGLAAKLGKQLGSALLVILFTAIISNLNIIPSASNSIELYSIIFEPLLISLAA